MCFGINKLSDPGIHDPFRYLAGNDIQDISVKNQIFILKSRGIAKVFAGVYIVCCRTMASMALAQ